MDLTRRILFGCFVATTACSSLGPSDEGISSIRTITVDNRARTYLLHDGAALGNGARPLLLVFHGLGGSSIEMEANTGFDGTADHFGFLVAYLDAAPGTNATWALDCNRCTGADTLGISDLSFVDSVIADVSRSHSVDSTRIYATGFSLGSYMTQVVACKRSRRIAAAAAVAGHMNAPMAAACPPASPVPMLVVTGLADFAMPWNGTTLSNGTRIFSADSTAAFWASRNGCALTARDTTVTRNGYSSVAVREYSQCTGSADVHRWGIEGLGHTWPRMDPYGTRDIVQFLLRFRR